MSLLSDQLHMKIHPRRSTHQHFSCHIMIDNNCLFTVNSGIIRILCPKKPQLLADSKQHLHRPVHLSGTKQPADSLHHHRYSQFTVCTQNTVAPALNTSIFNIALHIISRNYRIQMKYEQKRFFIWLPRYFCQNVPSVCHNLMIQLLSFKRNAQFCQLPLHIFTERPFIMGFTGTVHITHKPQNSLVYCSSLLSF